MSLETGCLFSRVLSALSILSYHLPFSFSGYLRVASFIQMTKQASKFLNFSPVHMHQCGLRELITRTYLLR